MKEFLEEFYKLMGKLKEIEDLPNDEYRCFANISFKGKFDELEEKYKNVEFIYVNSDLATDNIYLIKKNNKPIIATLDL